MINASHENNAFAFLKWRRSRKNGFENCKWILKKNVDVDLILLNKEGHIYGICPKK